MPRFSIWPASRFKNLSLVCSPCWSLSFSQVFAVSAHSAHSEKAELIAQAKAKPGQLNFASSGHGAAAHLAGELFKAEAKVDIIHVAYKGAAPALQDVIAGHVHMMFATAASVVRPGAEVARS